VPPTPECPQLQQLAEACLQLDPNKRPTATQAVQTLKEVEREHGLSIPDYNPEPGGEVRVHAFACKLGAA
jgi:hypothetical protein